jgi:hypothetical protein
METKAKIGARMLLFITSHIIVSFEFVLWSEDFDGPMAYALGLDGILVSLRRVIRRLCSGSVGKRAFGGTPPV